jgi:hypothetical protein
MKFTAIKAAVAICLMVPVMAMAATTKTFTAKAEPLNISINGIGSVKVGASWTDLLATYTDGRGTPYAANSLTWTLTKGNTIFITDTFDDATITSNTGVIAFNEAGLTSGNYKLNFVGKWIEPAKNLDSKEDPTVSFGKVSYSVSPVPEPESYAMFLAGLGLVGTIALRRRKANAS